jgi:Sec-independent protein translocase protein TatA
MFDVSWGELFVVAAVGVALTGKKDLPAACRFAGTQVGRLVGILQGARARADQFAQHNELRQLQNELRSGLRELDQVKMELAVAASSRGVLGRSLGATTPSANRLAPGGGGGGGPVPRLPPPPAVPPALTSSGTPPSSLAGSGEGLKFDFHVMNDNDSCRGGQPAQEGRGPLFSPTLPPAVQTERAVVEEEWEKQGIGFKARAEQGTWDASHRQAGSGGWDTSRATGSELLEHLERQCLIFDQYDRVVGEKDAEIQNRIDRIRQQNADKGTKQ